ncbi:hypothetical protein [Agrobacterium sp. S2/73]|nr:hypothetical protein [Agrobacterium sp. S2/73]
MKNRFQSLFAADCVQLLRNSTTSCVWRIVFPPNAHKDIAKNMSVVS